MKAVPKAPPKCPWAHQPGFLPLHGSSCPAQPGATSWSKPRFKNSPGMWQHEEGKGSWLLSSQGEGIQIPEWEMWNRRKTEGSGAQEPS